jgi:hypothetical protein
VLAGFLAVADEHDDGRGLGRIQGSHVDHRRTVAPCLTVWSVDVAGTSSLPTAIPAL